MPLLKAGRFVADEWIHLGQDDDLPPDGDVTVPFARLADDLLGGDRRVAALGEQASRGGDDRGTRRLRSFGLRPSCLGGRG